MKVKVLLELRPSHRAHPTPHPSHRTPGAPPPQSRLLRGQSLAQGEPFCLLRYVPSTVVRPPTSATAMAPVTTLSLYLYPYVPLHTPQFPTPIPSPTSPTPDTSLGIRSGSGYARQSHASASARRLPPRATRWRVGGCRCCSVHRGELIFRVLRLSRVDICRPNTSPPAATSPPSLPRRPIAPGSGSTGTSISRPLPT